MLIALDYDGTYTADPELWELFIVSAQNRGHKVIVATMRYESEPIEIAGLEVFYSGRKAKRAYLTSLGIIPQIWIDDMPDFILHGSA